MVSDGVVSGQRALQARSASKARLRESALASAAGYRRIRFSSPFLMAEQELLGIDQGPLHVFPRLALVECEGGLDVEILAGAGYGKGHNGTGFLGVASFHSRRR